MDCAVLKLGGHGQDWSRRQCFEKVLLFQRKQTNLNTYLQILTIERMLLFIPNISELVSMELIS